MSRNQLIRAGADAAERLNRLVGTSTFAAAIHRAKSTTVYDKRGKTTSLALLWATEYAADVQGGPDLVFGDLDLLKRIGNPRLVTLGERLFRHCTLTPKWDKRVAPVGITREHIAHWIVARLRWEDTNSPTIEEMKRRQMFYEVLITGDPIYREFLVKHGTLGEVIDILRRHVRSPHLARVQAATWEHRYGHKL